MSATPTLMPKLARGKHRNPRRGGCFMELASYLAGEPWSDSPACTHPALANLARLVNDLSTDEARPQLAPLVPGVIGHGQLGSGFTDEVALMVVAAALPIAPQDRQRALATGTLRLLGDVNGYDSPARAPWPDHARATLADHAGLERWARDFARRIGPVGIAPSPAAPITEIAVCSIAAACIPDPDARLRALLHEAIDWAHTCAGSDPARTPALQPRHWQQVLHPA